VTVVDAERLISQLESAHEAQTAFADIVIINKTGLVTSEEIVAVKKRIRSIVHETQRRRIAFDEVLQRDAFSLDRILEVEPDFLEGDHPHEHDDEVTSLALTSAHPLGSALFFPLHPGCRRHHADERHHRVQERP